MKTLIALLVATAAIGCGGNFKPPAERERLAGGNADIDTLKGACIKVENVHPNAFTGEPEYIAVWFLEEGGRLWIMLCHPSSPNWKKMNGLEPYHRYVIKTKLAETGKRSEMVSIEDLGEWIIK